MPVGHQDSLERVIPGQAISHGKEAVTFRTLEEPLNQ